MTKAMITRIRKATAQDRATIWRMILREGLDPSAVHWSQFLIAHRDGEVIGVGQIRPYPNCKELGSLVVHRDYQGQGVAIALVHALLQTTPQEPIYLECPSEMTPFYEKFGFIEIPTQDAPQPLRRKSQIGGWFAKLFGLRVVVMRRPQAVIPADDAAPDQEEDDDITH